MKEERLSELNSIEVKSRNSTRASPSKGKKKGSPEPQYEEHVVVQEYQMIDDPKGEQFLGYKEKTVTNEERQFTVYEERVTT